MCANNASELEIFRAAARAGDAYRHAHREYYTDGDTALDELERVCGDWRVGESAYEKEHWELADLGVIV